MDIADFYLNVEIQFLNVELKIRDIFAYPDCRSRKE